MSICCLISVVTVNFLLYWLNKECKKLGVLLQRRKWACGRTVTNRFVYHLNHSESRLQPILGIRRLSGGQQIPVKLGFPTN